MNSKLFTLGLALIFVLSFSFALSFPGKTYSFQDVNLPLVYSGSSFCVPINLDSVQKDTLKNTPGVLGMLLHIKSGNANDFFFVQSDLGIVYSRTIFGFNVNYRQNIEDAQDNYLYVDLEPARASKLDLFLCSSSESRIVLFDDSQIGSYRLPYFSGDSFTKSFMNENYKINEKNPIKVVLTNSGFADANVFLFYDNELFTRWFKLKDGIPSLNKNISPKESVSLEYNIVPTLGKSFTVSPAVVRYSFNGYVFTEYSNGLISNARAYLDEIFVNIDLSKKELDLNEDANLTITLLNDSDKEKAAVLLVDGLDKFGLNTRYEITLKPLETKKMNYTLSANTEKIVTLNVSLIAGDNEKSQKNYGEQTVYFGKPITNYNYIFVLVAIILVVIVAIYYRYGL